MKKIPLTLPARFAIGAAAAVFLMALITQNFYSHQLRNALEMRLREKASFVNNFYTILIGEALRSKDDVTLFQVVNRLEEDREITAVRVVDQTGEIRYDADTQKIGVLTDDPSLKNVMQSGDGTILSFQNAGGKALALIAPLKAQGQPLPIGAVRIEMTYLQMEKAVDHAQNGYLAVVLGQMAFGAGLAFLGVQNWVLGPLRRLKNVLTSSNPTIPEANGPESDDEFGEINKAFNDWVLRLRSEWQTQQSQTQDLAEREKIWVDQLAHSFLPDARVLVADKDNHVMSDTGNGVGEPGHHLLDLIKDANFATLLTNAFQQEGEVARGPVTFQDKSYDAAILSVPVNQALAVKTLIALRPT